LKLVIAIIQPTKLKAVQEALAKVGVERMTLCDAQGYGRQRGQTAVYRGVEYKTNLLRKVALEIVVQR
jgi:nitrogen regulatory protein PII